MSTPLIVPKSVREIIFNIAESESVGSGEFVCRIVEDYFRQVQLNKDEGWIQRDSNQLKNISWEYLVDHSKFHNSCLRKKPLNYREPQHGLHKRSFKPSKELLGTITSELLNSPSHFLGCEFVELGSGKHVRNKIKSKGKYGDAATTYPPLIRKALKQIEDRVFNSDEILKHLQSYDLTTGAASRFIRDLGCWIHILSQKPEELPDKTYSYTPAYEAQSSGRVGEIGFGLQSCTREMKAASAIDIELYNYDLKSSHPTILKQLCEQVDIECPWIDKYLESDKSDYAKRIGVSVDCWKELLMATIYGARKKTLKNIIEKHGYSSTEYQKFNSEVKDLLGIINKLHPYLQTNHPALHKYNAKGEVRYRNATESTLSETSMKSNPKAKLLSFAMQGLEAAFIHQLTILSVEYDYVVIGNEHDGLVTIGEIPEEAISKASELSGLLTPSLVEKDFI